MIKRLCNRVLSAVLGGVANPTVGFERRGAITASSLYAVSSLVVVFRCRDAKLTYATYAKAELLHGLVQYRRLQ